VACPSVVFVMLEVSPRGHGRLGLASAMFCGSKIKQTLKYQNEYRVGKSCGMLVVWQRVIYSTLRTQVMQVLIFEACV
jgi:hypothetical protein